jgi:hypothetical protein
MHPQRRSLRLDMGEAHQEWLATEQQAVVRQEYPWDFTPSKLLYRRTLAQAAAGPNASGGAAAAFRRPAVGFMPS